VPKSKQQFNQLHDRLLDDPDPYGYGDTGVDCSGYTPLPLAPLPKHQQPPTNRSNSASNARKHRSIMKNSAELYMAARVTLDKVADTMASGPTRTTLEHLKRMQGEVESLLHSARLEVQQSEERETRRVLASK
jgi:hypothetical protein